MGTVLLVLILIICFLLVAVVLIQNSKGGGLASNFSSSNQIMGVRRTADFLEKATWTLASSLLVLSLIYSAVENKSTTVQTPQSEIEDLVNKNQPVAPPSGFQQNNTPAQPTAPEQK